ncbi:hypothetical protein GCM10009087_31290 [Sphingomonas oligophenolica]
MFAVLLAIVVTAMPPYSLYSVSSERDNEILFLVAFGALSFFGVRAFPGVPLALLGERLSFAGTLTEVIQAVSGLHRDREFLDWVTDTAAIAVNLILVRGLRGRARDTRA